MMPALNIPLIRDAHELLCMIEADSRLLHLKNLCENNGTWAVPEDPLQYRPVMYEVQLFGVAANAATAEALPTNWMRAAQNILEAIDAEAGAPC